MSLPSSQIIFVSFVVLVSESSLKYWQVITSVPKRHTILLHLSKRVFILIFFGGEGGSVVLAAMRGKIRQRMFPPLYCNRMSVSPLLCGHSHFILYVPCSLLY